MSMCALLHPVRRVLILCVMTSTFIFCASAIGQTPLIQYKFDEPDGDAINTGSVAGADGVLGPMTTRTTNTPGGASAFAVDLSAEGLDSFVNGGDVAAVDTLAAFTLTTWINLQGLNFDQLGPPPGSANVRLIAKQGGAPNFDGFSWNINDPLLGVRGTDNFRLGLFIGGVDTFDFGQSTEDLGADNSWTFVAATYDSNAAESIRFFHGNETTATSMLGDSIPTFAGAVASTAGVANYGVGFTDAAITADTAADGYQDDVRIYGEALTMAQIEAIRLEGITPTMGVTGDFNNDTFFDCLDIDALTAEVVAGTNNPDFDMNSDGFVNIVDRNQWLVDGAAANGVAGPYLIGDHNLSGAVDVSDFNDWNANKFTNVAAWCSGDNNADGFVDVSDFNNWNANKFTLSGGAAAVPEPTGWVLLGLAALLLTACRRRKS